jgi:hypothetical protein
MQPIALFLSFSAGLVFACGGPNLAPATTLGPAANLLVPTNTATCADGYPIQINASFPQPFYGQGAGSCTLVTYSGFQPPSSGRVVSATIGIGPTTGPMRFVRMRILDERSTGPACCSAEQFGPVFTPQANGLTTVPLDFPITHDVDTKTGIVVNDWVGLEVLTPNVPIPGVWTNNGGADLTLPDYLWLPGLFSRGQGAPTQNLRSEGSFSGLAPTFNISFAAAR